MMKRSIVLIISFIFLLACGSGTEEEPDTTPKDTIKDTSQAISPELEKLHQASNDLLEESQKLNDKADSIYKSI